MSGTLAAVCSVAGSDAGAAAISFCDAGLLSKELDAARTHSSDQIRLQEIDKLYREISMLKKEERTNSEIPGGYIRNCMEKKEQMLLQHVSNCSSSCAAKYEYNFVLGQYFELQGLNKKAYDRYMDAARINPRDYAAPYQAFKVWEKLQSERMDIAAKGEKGLTQKDAEEVLSEITRLLQPIMQSPTAPNALRVEAYRTRAELMFRVGRLGEAMSDWRQVLTLDPKNIYALSSLASFEKQRGRKAEARQYLESLAPLSPDNFKVQQSLIELQLDAEDYTAALRTSEAVSPKFKTNPELSAMRAQALAGEGRVAEATPLAMKAYQENSKSPVIKAALAFIHLINGEKWADDKLFGKALAEYEAALALNPENQRLRKKMATLLFEQRQATNFEPREPTRKDMDRAVQLLEPLMKKDFVEQRIVEIMISAAAKSNRPALGAPSCARYQADFGSMPHVGLVVDCAKDFKAAGEHEKARKILEDALTDPRFKGTTSQIAAELTNAKQ
ncbi:MAG: hypothetical protein JST16_06605 [Bdellovibrionales bacterium]|nr:hypothetical protein [Bdellovibrionales bacterium]